MEKRRTRMGVDSKIDTNKFKDETTPKSFILANFERFIAWARMGLSQKVCSR